MKIGQKIAQWDPTTAENRIAMVGMYDSGKTVLLTSLIDHLNNHDPSRFRLDPDGKTVVRKFHEIETRNGWDPFPYRKYRDELVHNQKWPDKTSDRWEYACAFEGQGLRWPWKRLLRVRSPFERQRQLRIYDFAGERVADLGMMGRDFAEWSDWMIGRLASDRAYRQHAKRFLQFQQANGSGESDRCDEPSALPHLKLYRETLASLIVDNKPLVSPSTFVLDTEGARARGSEREISSKWACGIDAESEFAPLSAEWRAQRADLLKAFSKRYRAYKTRIVKPLVEALLNCHSLVVVVDITMLLAGGTGMYNDCREMIEELLQVLKPGEGPWRRTWRGSRKLHLSPLKIEAFGISRLAFAAAKVDLVHPMDRGRVDVLLKDMVQKSARDYDAEVEYFNCIAVNSTEVPDETKRELQGELYRDSNGRRRPPGREEIFTVSEVPDAWPLEWESGEYAFPRVYPQVEKRKDYPPDQTNLDALLRFTMGANR